MNKDSKEAHLQKQRRWMRLESRVHIHYRIDSEETFKAGVARDISEGGIKFETNRQIPLRTILWLAIQLPLYIKSLKTKAEIVSAYEAEANGSYEIGVRFLDIGERTRSRIACYIDEITGDVKDEDKMGADREIAQVLEEKEDLTIPDNRQVRTKEVGISALIKEIEALEMVFDEEKGICQLGKLAALSFHDLKGCPPLMLGLKFKEAVVEPLLGKYGLNEEEMEEVMERCKKKFKALGARYYIHAIKRREG